MLAPSLSVQATVVTDLASGQSQSEIHGHLHDFKMNLFGFVILPFNDVTFDIEPGKKLLLECKKAGARIYPTNEAFAQGLKTEEFGTGVMWKARVVQWQNAGINVQTVAPIEGVPMYVSGFVVPKNAPNKAGAYAYLDAMMAPSAQEGFAVDMGYNPTVTNAVVAPDLNQRIGFTPEEVKKLVDLDYDHMNKNDVAFKEWWDKVLKG